MFRGGGREAYAQWDERREVEVARGVTHAAPSPIAVIAAEIVSVAVKLKGSCHEYQWRCKSTWGRDGSSPGRWYRQLGCPGPVADLSLGRTMARVGANKIPKKID